MNFTKNQWMFCHFDIFTRQVYMQTLTNNIMAILIQVMEMRDKKLKNVVTTELEYKKSDALSDDYFEFLKNEFNNEIKSFWKLFEGEDME